MNKSNILPRHENYELPVSAYGEGCYIFDVNGKKYLDGSCGAAVSCLGHSDNSVQVSDSTRASGILIHTESQKTSANKKPSTKY